MDGAFQEPRCPKLLITNLTLNLKSQGITCFTSRVRYISLKEAAFVSTF